MKNPMTDGERLLAYSQHAKDLAFKNYNERASEQENSELGDIYHYFKKKSPQQEESIPSNDTQKAMEEAKIAYQRLMDVHQQLKKSYKKVLLKKVNKD